MAVKNHGISADLLIHPGETISDLLKDRGMTQKELAQRACVSEAFLSDVIRGKKDISKGLAKGLEYVFGTPCSFWLNLQANYDAELITLTDRNSPDPDEKTVLKSIGEIVNWLKTKALISSDGTAEETVIELRRYFHVSRLTGLHSLVPASLISKTSGSSAGSDVPGAWLCLCMAQKSATLPQKKFESERCSTLTSEIRDIISGGGEFTDSLKELLFQYGIDFSVIPAFSGIRMQEYIAADPGGTYMLVAASENTSPDRFGLSLERGILHIANGDIPKNGFYVGFADDEEAVSSAGFL